MIAHETLYSETRLFCRFSQFQLIIYLGSLNLRRKVEEEMREPLRKSIRDNSVKVGAALQVSIYLSASVFAYSGGNGTFITSRWKAIALLVVHDFSGLKFCCGMSMILWATSCSGY
jgi:hypothetical protein